MLHVFMPLKDPRSAKSRLAGLLSKGQREELVQAMALDVAEVVLGDESPARLTVIGPTCWEDLLPRTPNLRLLPEAPLSGEGLNELLREAVALVNPVQALVLHGDLPSLCAQDVRDAGRQLQKHDVVICPDAVGSGTNALGFRADARPEFRFGRDSFAGHRSDAESARVQWVALARPGLASDVDTPEDLARLLRRTAAGEWVGASTSRWAKRHGPDLQGILGVAPRKQSRSRSQPDTPGPVDAQARARSAMAAKPGGVPL